MPLRIERPFEFGYQPNIVAGGVAPANPIGQMIYEHEGAGRLLEALRKTTQNYAVLPDFCTSFRALYDGLQQLEADLHEHIFLENNILFPKAISLEEQVRTT